MKPPLTTSANCGQLKKLSLRGDHYSIGFQLGQHFRGMTLEDYSPERLQFALRCRDLLKDIYPPLLEKEEGMIAGGNFDPRRFQITYYLQRVRLMACAGFALAPEVTSCGNPLVGRNYHWSYAAWHRCHVREAHTKSAFATLGYTHHWASCPDILNGEGLYLSLFSLGGPHPRTPGLQWHMIMDVVAETCRNADEAARLIASLPHLGHFAYLIADRDGAMAVAEVAPDRMRVRRPEDGFIVMTNHCVTDDDGHVRNRASVARYQRIIELITKHLPDVDQDDAKEILADHQEGVCLGPPTSLYWEDDNRYGTIYALICRPRQLELSIAPGHPCRTPFYPVRLGLGENSQTQKGRT